MDALQLLLKGVVVVFVVSSMLSIGLAARIAEIIAPLRHPVWVLRALVANFVLAPAVALAITAVLPLEPGYELGLLLLGFAAGAPFLPKLADIGRAHVPTATALMVLLMAGSVVAMPLALPLLVKGLQVNPLRIAAPLVVLMLAPLLLGMAAQRFVPQAGAKLLPALTKVSNISFVAVVILICGTNLTALVGVAGQRCHRRSDPVRVDAVRWRLDNCRAGCRGAPPAGLCDGRAQYRRGTGHRRGKQRRASGRCHADRHGSGRAGIAACRCDLGSPSSWHGLSIDRSPGWAGCRWRPGSMIGRPCDSSQREEYK